MALAAIRALNQKVEAGIQEFEVRSRRLEVKLEQKETEIAEILRQNKELRDELAELKAFVNRVTATTPARSALPGVGGLSNVSILARRRSPAPYRIGHPSPIDRDALYRAGA